MTPFPIPSHHRALIYDKPGTGGLGHLALQMGARGMGFRMIVSCQLRDPDMNTDEDKALDFGDKADFAAECGAEAYIDLSKYESESQPLAAEVKKRTPNGLGAAAVLVCTAANEAYAQALSLLRFNGMLICIGVPEGKPVPIATAFPATLIAQELQIVGSVVGNRADATETMQMAARGLVKTRVAIQPMDSLMDVFQKMNSRTLTGRVVLDLTV
ncbi:hypothetical protein BJX99DRAFT_263381 [Aspergillus californicus]